ncbi:MAG: hypothetical protein EZS28_047923, partial [Streblomastix strix]
MGNACAKDAPRPATKATT